MDYHPLHSWDVSPKEAIKIQESLREKIIKEGPPQADRVRLVGGVDVGFPRKASPRGKPIARAVVVVLSFPDLKVIEEQAAEVPVTFPYFRSEARKRSRVRQFGGRGSYIPGLLAFREAPAVLAVVKKLENEPDLFIFDAQGYAHPRQMGLATHLGLFLDKPSIGCAKSKLTGSYQVPGNRVGDRTDLVDKDEVIGAVVRTRPGSPPLFISIGHKISLNEAVKYVLACTKQGNRLPETTRLAHQIASQT